jgi:Flp pilus assembly protein TadG
LAIVLPVFLLVMIGIIEFGRAVMVQQILVNAAREAARRAIVPGATTDEVKKLILGDEDADKPVYLKRASLYSDNAKVAIWGATVGEDLDLADAESHDLIQVVVQLPYDDVGVSVPAIYTYFGGKLMKARVQMRKE